MKKRLNKHKFNLKVLSAIVFSNCLLYLLIPQKEQIYQKCNQGIHYRQDYISLRIKGKLKTAINYQRPVTITDPYHQKVIKNVFILKQLESNQAEVLLNQKDHLLVEIPKKDFLTFIKIKDPLIYPHNIELKHQIRKTHEITF